MILVTVGGQLPFDRLVRAVDDWAGRLGRADVYAQIGRGAYEPRHFPWGRFLNPLEFRRRVGEARLIVAHAGMGSIITALELGKPIVVLPRRASLREHRNDHQLASARRFVGRAGVRVAMDEGELSATLDELAEATSAPTEVADPEASGRLLEALQRFVSADGRRPGAR